MPHNTKEKRNAYRREYMKTYRPANREKFKMYEDKYLSDPTNLQNKKEVRQVRESSQKDRFAKYKRDFNIRRLEAWSPYIPEVTNCEVCRQLISFKPRPDMGQIHFDHRQGGIEAIQISPRKWLRNHLPTEANLKIWESCDFGLLCLGCNSILPTVGRIEFLKNALIYAEGLR